DFEDGHTSILQIESRLDKFRSRVDRRNEIEICHLAGVFYLNFAKPELALKWTFRNRNRKIEQYRPDLLAYSHVLFLLAHFELGNWDIIHQNTKPISTILRRADQLNHFYETVLACFHDLGKAKNDDARRTAFQKFGDELNELYAQNGWARMNYYFNLRVWIQAKIDRAPMVDLLKVEFGY
ncbi:MAG: hypothetical protein AAF570_22925, partial [Bacteroidota bacterium]